MEKIKINKCLLFASFLMPSIGFAQFSNTGKLYISPGTKLSCIAALDNKNSGDLINDGELFIYSDYNNEGLATYSTGSTTSKTFMYGNADQKISGTIPIELYNVEFNNTNTGFHLSNTLSISGKANFNKGIIDGDGLVVFEDNSEYENISDNSYIDGSVRKNGDDFFIFPIGSNGIHSIAQIDANNLTDNFTGKYFFETANQLYPLTNKVATIDIINNQEYWSLDVANGSSSAVFTLSWDLTELNTNDLESNIHIVRWDPIQNLWVDEGGAVDNVNKTVSIPINISGHNIYTTAKVNKSAILDKIVFFNAISPNNDGINDYFKIEGLTNPNNKVEIYNRWGAKIFETKAYDTNGNVFRGISENGTTINKNKTLPVGTYFYILTFNSEVSNKTIRKVGYLYINQ